MLGVRGVSRTIDLAARDDREHRFCKISMIRQLVKVNGVSI